MMREALHGSNYPNNAVKDQGHGTIQSRDNSVTNTLSNHNSPETAQKKTKSIYYYNNFQDFM